MALRCGSLRRSAPALLVLGLVAGLAGGSWADPLDPDCCTFETSNCDDWERYGSQLYRSLGAYPYDTEIHTKLVEGIQPDRSWECENLRNEDECHSQQSDPTIPPEIDVLKTFSLSPEYGPLIQVTWRTRFEWQQRFHVWAIYNGVPEETWCLNQENSLPLPGQILQAGVY